MADLDEFEPAQPASYTGKGDSGRTSFGRHGDVAKTGARVAAYEDCDEANAAVGVAMAVGGLPLEVTSTLASVQNDLFDLVADLSVPLDDPESAAARIRESHLARLERAVDHFAQQAADLSGFVLPGGTVAAALLYQARGVVRRAERGVWAAVEEHPTSVNPLGAAYLNRLSSLLFVLARGANADLGDVKWMPEASARAMAQEDGGDDSADQPAGDSADQPG
ncbi:cob(I)yrinic acid a,c-diamide adenosyltransferase [Cryobacterium sp. Sr8]|uniref:cob(I)yrinic acid a,c-diamide adenosyltransferase n=1 Tax=Cryobacterium sp. Sr8 TaxID=1259203 RepID=UPI001068F8AC|nr:cob(I)yrinic acid a,c-diamide adenosyltransferase [Cryobacterium sp. Sr8]TFD76100.1 cob(I)yrinic acid a,c-diamide adenosyltransferase [Cryobacterium sp. Sr8]